MPNDRLVVGLDSVYWFSSNNYFTIELKLLCWLDIDNEDIHPSSIRIVVVDDVEGLRWAIKCYRAIALFHCNYQKVCI